MRAHELIEWEIAVAYHDGYRAALADIAAGHAELDAVWRPLGRRGYEQRVADRISEMERHARRLRDELERRARRRGRAEAGWPVVAVPGARSRVEPSPVEAARRAA